MKAVGWGLRSGLKPTGKTTAAANKIRGERERTLREIMKSHEERMSLA